MAHMKFGVFIFPTDQSIRPDVLAKEAEDRGFESFWVPEHSHIPTSRVTPWGGREEAPPLPEQYWRTHDQFVALAFAAATTSTIKLGTGITLLAQRDPIWTAKEVASLDALSGGRLEFGIGYGWNKEEMAQHGTKYLERRALLREKLLLMKNLWTEDEVAFSGDIIEFESSWAWPKPAQSPHPPVIMGAAAGPRTLADMIEFCDGWLPNAQHHDIAGEVSRVREAVADAGRDVEAFEISAFAAKIPMIDDLRDAGLDRAIFTMPPVGAEVVIPKLDALAEATGVG